ncbi:IclR family transcriptional regulator domain-containing protein [Cryobacterium ruanii]|uniref:IclR-ED domain-containing protein n=1 Tax=Cryobacterium ruanii TaxID=1259197 RepID=A0A4R9ARH2_9MICO|nr:hypothetical protein E3T47_03630 [Cryobacterium ruanii]
MACASADVLESSARRTAGERNPWTPWTPWCSKRPWPRTAHALPPRLKKNELRTCCVGVPIMDSSGRVVAGMSVSTPRERFLARIGRLGACGRAKADEISRTLATTSPSNHHGLGPWPRASTAESTQTRACKARPDHSNRAPRACVLCMCPLRGWSKWRDRAGARLIIGTYRNICFARRLAEYDLQKSANQGRFFRLRRMHP